MDESLQDVFQSNKRFFWLLVMSCIIGFALLLSALRGYPADSLAHGVLKFFGLLFLSVGVAVLLTDLVLFGQLELPISASVWVAIDGAEKIDLNNDLDRAMLENVLRDVREYKKRKSLVYPPILQLRITALEEKLRKK